MLLDHYDSSSCPVIAHMSQVPAHMSLQPRTPHKTSYTKIKQQASIPELIQQLQPFSSAIKQMSHQYNTYINLKGSRD